MARSKLDCLRNRRRGISGRDDERPDKEKRKADTSLDNCVRVLNPTASIRMIGASWRRVPALKMLSPPP